jgi:hypothetical protein
MRKQIANLEVWIDDTKDGIPTGLHSASDNYHFAMVIKPTVDNEVLERLKHNPQLKPIQSIIAHELGHFVARLTHDSTHKGKGIYGNTPLVPTEEKAWEIGRVINPQVDEQIVTQALSSYKERDKALAAYQQNGGY